MNQLPLSVSVLLAFAIPTCCQADDPVHLGRIRVVGNTCTPDWFVKSFVPFREGQIVAPGAIREVGQRFAGLSYFTAAETVYLQPADSLGVRDVIVQIQEKPGAGLVWSAVELGCFLCTANLEHLSEGLWVWRDDPLFGGSLNR